MLYLALGIIVIRGLGAILGAGEPAPAPLATTPGPHPVAQAQEALAVGFAAEWLTLAPGGEEARRERLAAYLAPELLDAADAGAVRVAQRVIALAPAGRAELADDEAIVTVAATVAAGPRVVRRYLSVPVAHRDGALSVSAAPALVAAPPRAELDRPAEGPITDAAAADIATLVEQFLPALLGGGGPERVAFFLAPGVSVRPVAPALREVAVRGIEQVGPAGPSRLVRVRAQGLDPATGALLPLSYLLSLRQGAEGRWQVVGVNQAPPAAPGG